jgi:uncharacterized membrane protein YfcA
MSFEYWYTFPYAVAVASVASASGFSGAVLFQPFYYFVLQLPVQASIATGIATETIGMSGAAYRYQVMRFHRWDVWRALVPWVMLGVVAGFTVFVKAPPIWLKGLVGLTMLLVAAIQMYALRSPFGAPRPGAISRWAPVGLVAGAFSASTGTGVAEMMQPLVEHRGGVETRRANATAILLEACADIGITLLNLSVGAIRWDILVFTASGVLVGSQIGPRIAPRLPAALVKTVFAAGIAGIGAFYVWSVIPTLLP